jgi:thiamine pyrophosphokinase
MDLKEQKDSILIISGGFIEEAFLQDLIGRRAYSMIIAADHGLVMADKLHIPLDYIVGDFDSVPEELLKKYRDTSVEIKTFPPEKDKTDTQIAIELALMHAPSTIDLVGAMGSRLDHTLANLHLLMLPMQLNVEAHLLDQNNRISLRQSGFTLTKAGQYGDYVSLLPFAGEVKGLTLTGFKYPLNHVTLSPGSSLGISNEIKDEEARVELSEGILVVFESRD